MEIALKLWRSIFPKYNCPWCRDTGVLHDRYAIAYCHHCRDIKAEVRAAAKKLYAAMRR